MKILDMVGHACNPNAGELEKWNFLGSVASQFSITGKVYSSERAYLNTKCMASEREHPRLTSELHT